MSFEWLADPTAWLGLGTLVVLEIVLGIDNLVFIAILADKLPENQRNRARLIGLSLALFMRLALLASISWVVSLTEPLFTVFGFGISGRDLILILGGLFLLFKATMELHERLEGGHGAGDRKVAHAVFWQVILQIVALDAVFSLDSVITAVGMVDNLTIMMTAVLISIIVMMTSSGPLMRFISAHPTVVVLCLSFLLMIGFSLVVEGLGFHIPKGYLYAAIGFSVLIEALNQLGRRNKDKMLTTMDLRARTAAAVVRLLGGRATGTELVSDEIAQLGATTAAREVFAPEEKSMIEGVLALADRPIRSIMTPKHNVTLLNVDAPQDELRRQILGTSHSRFPLTRNGSASFLGVALAKDVLRDLLESGQIDLARSARQPITVAGHTTVLLVMEQFRNAQMQMAIIVDDTGAFEGVVTPSDIFEAIAGDFPDGV